MLHRMPSSLGPPIFECMRVLHLECKCSKEKKFKKCILGFIKELAWKVGGNLGEYAVLEAKCEE